MALLSADRGARRAGLARLVRGPRRALVVGGVALAVAAIAAGAWWWTRPTAPWKPAVKQLLAYLGNADAPTISPDGRTLLLSQDVENANRWTVSTLSIDGGEPRRISPVGVRCVYGRWTRDGQAALMMCTRGGREETVRVPVAGGAPVVVGLGAPADDCGDAVAVIVHDNLNVKLVVHAADGTRRQVAQERYITRARCSPDGRQLAIVVPEQQALSAGALVLHDRDTGKREVVVPRGILEVAYTRGGTMLLVEEKDTLTTSLSELNLATRQIRPIALGEDHIRGPEVTADGSTLVFQRDITWVPVYEVELDGERRSLTQRQERIGGMVPVPGRDLLVASRARKDTYEVVTIDLATRAVKPIGFGVVPFPSRDGTSVYFATRHEPPRLGIVSIDGGAVRELGELPGTLVAGVDSAAGTQLVASTPAGPTYLAVGANGALVAAKQGLELPAGASGWTAIWSGRPMDGEISLIAPGQARDAATVLVRDAVGRPAWIDDHRLSYCDRRSCKVLDVVTREEKVGPRNPVHHANSVAAGLDGKRWFYNPTMGQVSLQKITNFNARR